MVGARTFLLAALLAAPALAQIEVLQDVGDTTRSLPAVLDFGSASVGDASQSWFRVRNAGTAATTLSTLTLGGSGFQILNRPTLPATIAPQEFVRFRVEFRPPAAGGYSAVLTVNAIQTILRATGIAIANLKVEISGARTLVSPGAGVSFGQAERDATSTLNFFVENTAGVTVAVQKISVEGEAYAFGNAPVLPASLKPGESLPFSVRFKPTAKKVYSGRLLVDDRTYLLAGEGIDPKLPPAEISLEKSQVESADQVKLKVKLSEKARASGSGKLTLQFTPAAGIDDQGVRFVAPEGRTLNFTVTEGDSEARFGTLSDATFSTGATAGTLTFTLELQDQKKTAKLTINAASPKMDSTAARRISGVLEIEVNGLDNTRSLSKIVLTFYDQNGSQIGNTIEADATAEFRKLYGESTVGGLFRMRATLPVAGDSSIVGAVDVEMRNSTGSAKSGKVRFQ